MAEGDPAASHVITPGETYQIDSDEWDSDEDREALRDEEYDRLVDEAENGFSDAEVAGLLADLKEKGIVNFLRDYLRPIGPDGEMPSLRKLLLGLGFIPPEHLRRNYTHNLDLLPYAKVALSRILRRREKLSQYNSVSDAVNLLRNAKNIIVLSGAGISTSCGIPDFRSANGLYAQLQDEGKWELDDPQQMFDIHFFREHPEVFYNFVPSPCHRWIKLLEERGSLLRNYTQNIDTLESLAGVEKVLQCHGSFKTASCLRCKTRVPGKNLEPYIMSSQIPFCGICREERDKEVSRIKAHKESKSKDKGKGKAKGWESESDSELMDEWGGGEPGIMKPDITFFGQALDSEFDECLFQDREKVDLLIIIGTSLKVAPVSEVLTHIPHSIPQIFINMTPVSHVKPDICLLGDADRIVTWLSGQLGWTIPPPVAVPSTEDAESGVSAKGAVPSVSDLRWITGVGDMSHVHLLATNSEADEAEEKVKRQGVDGYESDQSEVEGMSPAVAKLDIETPVNLDSEPSEEVDGYVTDNEQERPSKRQR